MTEALTTNLRLELDKTNQVFNRWADDRMDWLEKNDGDLQRIMEEAECTLNSLKDTERELEMLRTTNDDLKISQKEEIDYYVKQKEALLNTEKELLPKLRQLEEEEEMENNRLNEARSQYDSIRSQAERSIDDLTHGIRMYATLGLEFQKAEGQCMKFIFTLIDQSKPSKEFYFVMFVDDEDKYQLVKSEPKLPKDITSQLVLSLNTDNDIGKFVTRMRKQFQSTL